MVDIYYIEINLICIILLALYGYLLFNKLEQRSSLKIIFDALMLASIVFCLSDMIAGVYRGVYNNQGVY